jgi:hypothetical protein
MHVQPMNKCRSSKKLQYRVRNSESVFLYKPNQFSKGLDTKTIHHVILSKCILSIMIIWQIYQLGLIQKLYASSSKVQSLGSSKTNNIIHFLIETFSQTHCECSISQKKKSNTTVFITLNTKGPIPLFMKNVKIPLSKHETCMNKI